LKKLIDHVGIEDAGSLIEYSTPAQLVAVLDESIWKNPRPGTPETFNPQEFLRWLEAMLDVSDEFAAERLQALSDELLVTAFSYYLELEDLNTEFRFSDPDQDHFLPGSFENVDCYGSITARPRFDDEWEILSPALNAMHMFDTDWLQSLLYRCLPGGQMWATRDAETAQADAAADHERNREQQGFITPISAQAFLQSAKDTPLAELAAFDAYDIDASDYFRRVTTAQEADLNDQSATRQRLDNQADGAAPNLPDDEEPIYDPAQLKALQDLVIAVELNDAEVSMKRLAGPKTSGPDFHPATMAIQQALGRLADSNQPGLEQCMQELSYLSNIIMMGASLGGQRFTEREAGTAVLATCNLGLEYCPDARIDREPGLVRFFQLGWNLIQQIPGTSVDALVEALESKTLTAQMGIRAWLVADLVKEFKGARFHADLALGRFDNIQDALHMMSLVLDDQACHALGLFVADFPRTVDSAPGSETQTRRFISSLQDLAFPVSFCSNIHMHLKQKAEQI
jgi:hypothetical protein